MKKRILSLLLIFVLFISPVYADEVEDYIMDQAIEAGENVSYDKKVDGSTIVVGNVTKYSGVSKGLLFEAGNEVTGEGEAEYAALAGNNVAFKGIVSKDAFVFGNVIDINATVKRDMLVAGSTVTLSGVIERNVTIYASKVILKDVTILGSVTIKADDIFIDKTTTISGELNYKYTNALIDSSASIGSLHGEKYTPATKTNRTIKNHAISYGSILLVFVTLALLVPGLFKNIGDNKTNFFDIITYIGYALVFIILVPVLAIMLIMLSIGVPLALMIFVAYILVIYLSYAFTGYFIGKKIYQKTGREDNVLLEGLMGMTILTLLSFIPVVGPFITILAYLCGIGIIIFRFKK